MTELPKTLEELQTLIDNRLDSGAWTPKPKTYRQVIEEGLEKAAIGFVRHALPPEGTGNLEKEFPYKGYAGALEYAFTWNEHGEHNFWLEVYYILLRLHNGKGGDV